MKLSKIEKEITYKGYKGFIKLFEKLCAGQWRCAYVILPIDHKFNKIPYNCFDFNVHDGLTYSETGKYFKETTIEKLSIKDDDWVLGIDFAYLGDTIEEWSLEAVEIELKHLIDEIINETKQPIIILNKGINYRYNIEIDTKFKETFQLPIISNEPIRYSLKEPTKTTDKILQLILIYTKYNISLYKRSDGTYNLRFESLLSGEEFNLLIKLTKKNCELLNINPEVEYQYVREQFEDILRWLIKDNK